jgi:non-canonical purine NTP pyrophosphatase (RdgB/HAM1 family)
MHNDVGKFSLVTGNQNKVIEARRITGLDIKHVALDICEVQERTCAGVALAKAFEAYDKLRRPVIVEDSGLEFVALGGFPGPFIKHWEQLGGIASICRALDGVGERAAFAVCALAIADGGDPIVVEAHVAGSIARYPRGDGFGFDPIFIPASVDGMTFGELTGVGKDAHSHRGAAWRELLAKLATGAACA